MDETQGIPLGKFALRTKGLGLEAFQEEFTLASLVIEFPREDATGMAGLPGESEDTISSTEWDDRPTPGRGVQFLHFLKKSTRNTMVGMITVGRSHNNDIFLPHPTISKFHAFFKEDGTKGNYIITDVGSTNGTFYRSKRLEANRAYPLESQETVLFGKVLRGTFFLPQDLYAYVAVYRRMANLE